MHRDVIEGNWKRFKGRVQREWGGLTDRDVEEIGGSRTRLVRAIRERYGVARAEAEEQVSGWLDELSA